MKVLDLINYSPTYETKKKKKKLVFLNTEESPGNSRISDKWNSYKHREWGYKISLEKVRRKEN